MDTRIYSIVIVGVLAGVAVLAGLGFITVDDKEFLYGLLVGGGSGASAATALMHKRGKQTERAPPSAPPLDK